MVECSLGATMDSYLLPRDVTIHSTPVKQRVDASAVVLHPSATTSQTRAARGCASHPCTMHADWDG